MGARVTLKRRWFGVEFVMDRQRQLKSKRANKQRKHVETNPGEYLVFGAGTAAVKKIWTVGKALEGVDGRWFGDGFHIYGDDSKPAAPQDQP